MNREIAEVWLNKLKEYWFNKDIDKAVELFSKTTFYQETPFMKPYTTLEEINQEWQHVKNENIQDIEIKILAIDGYTVIAEWLLKQNNQEFDGIYEIKFNTNLECVYFKSWPGSRYEPPEAWCDINEEFDCENCPHYYSKEDFMYDRADFEYDYYRDLLYES